jgi:hypothetical protein
MTSDDNSPALGGRSDDNAPMISSVLTRVIVSARGAYTVGNLDALVAHMSDDQRLTYRCAIIRQILGVFKPDITGRAHTSPALQRFLAEMDRWLDEPTAGSAAALSQRINTLEANIPLDFGLQKLAYAVRYQGPDFPYYVRGIIAESGRIPAPLSEVLTMLVAEWQLEAAWAVLRGAAIPPEPHIDTATLGNLLADAHWCYEKRLLGLLARQFSLAQWMQFRSAILHQALWLLESCLHADQVSAALASADHRARIEQIRRWLDHPGTLTKPEHQQAMWEAGKLRRGSFAAGDAIAMTITLFDPDTVPEIHSLHDATIVTIVASLFEGHYDDNSTIHNRMRRREQAHQWQIEAAWAIFNHTPIPPFIAGA